MVKKIHFIGCEGVSMKILMSICKQGGFEVSGSDIRLNGHHPGNVLGADFVVVSAAVAEGNVEVLQAQKDGIPILSRAELLGKICKDYKFSVAVAGTHGKTTTTAMLWEILSPLDPTVHIGGNYCGRTGRIGGKGLFVTEACEYKRSFLSLHPDIALVLNIDLDHTDCYKDLGEMREAYYRFAQNARRLVIVGGDDKCFLDMVRANKFNENISDEELPVEKLPNENISNGIPSERLSNEKSSNEKLSNESISNERLSIKRYITVGLCRTNNYYATCLTPDKNGRYSFCVYRRGRRLGRVSLGVAGRHNVINALFAIAACLSMGISFGRISAGLNRFVGAERRMELLGYHEGCAVFSDYAHHPGEISTTILSARESGYKHITAVFEPHTYSRTQSFLGGFVDTLAAADRVVLLPVYAARENPSQGADSAAIADGLAAMGVDVVCLPDYESAKEYLKNNLTDDGVILFMGAGSIDTLARVFVSA